MTRRFLFIFIICSQFTVFSQESKEGKVTDKSNGEIVPRAHIQNLSQQKFTVSNEEGEFRLPLSLGDSLLISCVGYKTTGFIVQKEWANRSEVIIRLEVDSIFLEEVVIGELPNENVFKKQILNYQPKDTSMQIFGLPKTPPAPGLAEGGAPSIGLGSPFGALYNAVSKDQKERKKYQQILSQQRQIEQFRSKVNRPYISQLTNLKGEELTDFIAYCNFNLEEVNNMSDYKLAEVIMAKLDDFKKNQQS